MVAKPRRRACGQDEVPDLDDLPFAIEVVQRAAADYLAAVGVDGRQRQQSPFSASTGRSWIEATNSSRSDSRKVSRLTHFRVGKRREDRVHVIVRREAQDDAGRCGVHRLVPIDARLLRA